MPIIARLTLAGLSAFGSEHATVAILPPSGGLVLGGLGYRNGLGKCPALSHGKVEPSIERGTQIEVHCGMSHWTGAVRTRKVFRVNSGKAT